jgi:hypothetical protein
MSVWVTPWKEGTRAHTKEMLRENRYHSSIREALTRSLLATFWSASFFSSGVMSTPMATRWSRRVLRLFFCVFRRLSFLVRPVSSSSWRSSSEKLSSPEAGDAGPELSAIDSAIFGSSWRPLAVRTEGARGRELLSALAEPTLCMRLLLRRRWPNPLMGSISMAGPARDSGWAGLEEDIGPRSSASAEVACAWVECSGLGRRRLCL